MTRNSILIDSIALEHSYKVRKLYFVFHKLFDFKIHLIIYYVAWRHNIMVSLKTVQYKSTSALRYDRFLEYFYQNPQWHLTGCDLSSLLFVNAHMLYTCLSYSVSFRITWLTDERTEVRFVRRSCIRFTNQWSIVYTNFLDNTLISWFIML